VVKGKVQAPATHINCKIRMSSLSFAIGIIEIKIIYGNKNSKNQPSRYAT
jgi:hypothetical protein